MDLQKQAVAQGHHLLTPADRSSLSRAPRPLHIQLPQLGMFLLPLSAWPNFSSSSALGVEVTCQGRSPLGTPNSGNMSLMVLPRYRVPSPPEQGLLSSSLGTQSLTLQMVSSAKAETCLLFLSLGSLAPNTQCLGHRRDLGNICLMLRE